MHITLVKKRLLNGDPCPKCAQTEDMLRRRGLWDRVDEVVWAIEGDGGSAGAVLSRKHDVDRAPFFIVRDESGHETVFLSALQLIREHLSDSPKASTSDSGALTGELAPLVDELSGQHPREILMWAFQRHGERCALAFECAEDVVLIDMAVQLGVPVSIFAVDSGRMRPESYRFLDTVRDHYGVVIDVYFPDAAAVADLVRRKGPNSFLRDGHAECCALRRAEPQKRALSKLEAWVSGRRRDPGLHTTALPVVQLDFRSEVQSGLGLEETEASKAPLLRVNPLANWTRDQVFCYIEERRVPVNELHAKGFRTIGCEPCTRPAFTGQPAGCDIWWWEKPDAEPAVEPAGSGI